jgi:hypothetical protein
MISFVLGLGSDIPHTLAYFNVSHALKKAALTILR